MKQVVVSLPVQKKVNTSLMNRKMKEKEHQDQKGKGKRKIHQNQKVSVKEMLKSFTPLKKNRALSLLRYIEKSKNY